MSTDYSVRLPPDRVPSTQEWNDAIERAGFDLILNPNCEIREQSGFWPCTYRKEPAGFEFYPAMVDPEADVKFPTLEDLEPDTGGRDFRTVFSADSESDVAAAVIAAALLAEMTGGLVYDSWSGKEIAASEALVWARKSTTISSPEEE